VKFGDQSNQIALTFVREQRFLYRIQLHCMTNREIHFPVSHSMIDWDISLNFSFKFKKTKSNLIKSGEVHHICSISLLYAYTSYSPILILSLSSNSSSLLTFNKANIQNNKNTNVNFNAVKLQMLTQKLISEIDIF